MNEIVRTTAEIDVWGTILFIEVASTKVGLDELNAGLADLWDCMADEFKGVTEQACDDYCNPLGVHLFPPHKCCNNNSGNDWYTRWY